MYYIKRVEEKVRLPPSEFGSKITGAVLRMLREKYERRIIKNVGLVLSVDNPEIVSEGLVIPGDGGVFYTVQFDMLSFVPYVNEVYEGEIKDIVDFGAFATIGPIHGLIHISQISSDRFSYDKKQKVLVSRAGKKKTLKKGDVVLAKISTVSMKGSTADVKIGLTMRNPGLGKKEWIKEEKEGGKAKKEKKKASKKKK